ncbi:MAG: hypothetical protein R2828_08155 [Saprospiraceae bacterium]
MNLNQITIPSTDFPTSHLYAGSTNIESRWDWKWLGVCLVCCCFQPSTYDFQLHAGSTDIESRWDWKWLGVCLVCCCFPASCWLYQY